LLTVPGLQSGCCLTHPLCTEHTPNQCVHTYALSTCVLACAAPCDACLLRSALKQWAELREERDRTEASYQSRIFEAKAGLEGRIKRAEDISATFHHFRREVALAAEFTKSGRPLGERQLAQLEAAGEGLRGGGGGGVSGGRTVVEVAARTEEAANAGSDHCNS
jgi:hypothetical protein